MNAELIENLREREKELRCLFRLHEVLRDEESPLDIVLKKLVQIIPEGWQFPGIAMAKIDCEDIIATTPGFYQTNWFQSAEIYVEGDRVGNVSVFYNQQLADKKEPIFLEEEQQLLNIISQQLSQYIFNRKLKETIAYLTNSNEKYIPEGKLLSGSHDEHWKWRIEMVHEIANRTDFKYYGIKAVYIIGSVKEATAGPKSDIDLLVHFIGDTDQRNQFESYIKGWGESLRKINFDRTGFDIKEGLIDLHLVTSSDIKNRQNSFASMINSYSNSARLIRKEN